jgi:hypothetical protein
MRQVMAAIVVTSIVVVCTSARGLGARGGQRAAADDVSALQSAPPAPQPPPPQFPPAEEWDGLTYLDLINAVKDEFHLSPEGQLAKYLIDEELKEIQTLTDNVTFIGCPDMSRDCPPKEDPTKPAQSLDVGPPKDEGRMKPPPKGSEPDEQPSSLRSGPSDAGDDVDAEPIAAGPSVLDAPIVVFAPSHDGDVQMRIYSARPLTDAEVRAYAARRGIISPVSGPLRRPLAAFIAQASARGSGVHVTTLKMRGYCVEAQKPFAASGAIFTWAPHAAQEEFAGAHPVRAVAETAARRGYLRPQGDPEAYGRFITQYAIWTALEHWDEARFTSEFVTRTRDQYAAAHKSWTSEAEQTLRALAPARWRDVRRVLAAAARLESDSRKAGR